MKILITGGAGFIGSHLVEHFNRRATVSVLDDLRTGDLRNPVHPLAQATCNVCSPVSSGCGGLGSIQRVRSTAVCWKYSPRYQRKKRMNLRPDTLVIRRLLKHDRARVFSALTDSVKVAEAQFDSLTKPAPTPGKNLAGMIHKKGPIAGAFAALLLCALASGATAQSSTAFDGNWSVTMGAQDYNNPYNRGLSHAFEYHFPATVTHGVFHGERGTRGEQGFYELNGSILPDGSAFLSASGITRKKEYSQELVPPGTPYSYAVKALFRGSRGTGNSVGARVRIFRFTKN